jgi:hypothetical protein
MFMQYAAMAVLLMAALVIAAAAQSQTAGGSPVIDPLAPSVTAAGDRDISRGELNNFDRYLDDHPNVSHELRNNPNLVNDPNYLAQHPSLQGFLKNHPGVNEEIRENPAQFMNRENRFERNGGDFSRAEAASADRYLDRHTQVAQQLRQNPRLIDNPNYVAQHPGLQQYLQNHPEVRQDWKQHPYAFQKRERQYEKHVYRKPQSSLR